jgi:DNA-binding LytR/AlgR family response regulator
MDKLDNFETTIKLMRQGEIVKIHKPEIAYFAFKGDMIQAKNETSKYLLSLDVFTELFEDAEFFRYEKKEETVIDKAKDDEYYQWKHK